MRNDALDSTLNLNTILQMMQEERKEKTVKPIWFCRREGKRSKKLRENTSIKFIFLSKKFGQKWREMTSKYVSCCLGPLL